MEGCEYNKKIIKTSLMGKKNARKRNFKLKGSSGDASKTQKPEFV